MGTTYGKTWFVQNGIDPPHAWVSFLKTITPIKARETVYRCLEESPYIPSLATFIHFTKFKPTPVLNEHGLDYVPQHLRPDAKTHVTLPKPKADKVKAAEEMQKIRQMLK